MESEPYPNGTTKRRGGLLHRPWLWALLTAFLGSAAAYLRLEGQEASVAAISVSGLALAALFMVAWTLGHQRGADYLSRLLHAAADDSRDGILITDKDGRFVYANLAFHRLFHAAAEAGGRGRVTSLAAIERALPDGRAAAELQRLVAQARAGAPARAEFPIAADSGAVEWRRLGVGRGRCVIIHQGAHLSFFGFAIQNNKRPDWQKNALMEGAVFFCDEAMRRGYALHPFGNLEEFREVEMYRPLYERLALVQSGKYKPSSNLTVHIAVNYSGAAEYELGTFMDQLYFRGFAEVRQDPMRYLLSGGVPLADLVIRTGGECRLSGICPLQTVYAELRFVDISWMKYTTERFIADLRWFAQQKRNFGK